MVDVPSNLKRLHQEIRSTAMACGRNPEGIRLLAVSKNFSAQCVAAALGAGQRLFGENRVQEAARKIPCLSGQALEWHLIGPLQSNKARRAVGLFDVIQTLDRTRIVHRVGRCAAELGKVVRVFIEVNIAKESQKHGVLPHQLAPMVELVDSLPNLLLEGLMAIPPYAENPEASRPYFRQMSRLLDELNRNRQTPLRELSMGMSHDFKIAIEEGATLLRVGTAVFGPRSP